MEEEGEGRRYLLCDGFQEPGCDAIGAAGLVGVEVQQQLLHAIFCDDDVVAGRVTWGFRRLGAAFVELRGTDGFFGGED